MGSRALCPVFSVVADRIQESAWERMQGTVKWSYDDLIGPLKRLVPVAAALFAARTLPQIIPVL